MADPRHFRIVTTTSFDGSTVGTTTMAWTPASDLTQGPGDMRYRSLTVALLGLLPPEVLGRYKTASLIRVWADDPQSGDTVQVVGSSSATEADPVLWPRSAAIQLTGGSQSATVLEVNQTDQIKLDSGGPLSVYVEVLDLGEEQHFQYMLANQELLQAATAVTTETRVVSITAGVIYDLAPWTASVLYVVATAGAMNDVIRLPPATDVPLGAKVRIYRDSTRFFSVSTIGGDLLNGTLSPLTFMADHEATYIERSAEGWVTSYAPVDTNAIAVSGTNALSAAVRQRTRIEYTAGDGTLLQLPPNTECVVGQEFEIVVVGIGVGDAGGWLAPTAGQTLNSVADKRMPLVRVGDVIIARYVAPGAWICFSNDLPVYHDRYTVVADPNLTAEPVWHGIRYYECTYGAAGLFRLPTSPVVGQRIKIRSIGANVVTVDGGANAVVAGGTAAVTKALVANTPIDLTFFTGGWIASG